MPLIQEMQGWPSNPVQQLEAETGTEPSFLRSVFIVYQPRR